MAQEQLDKTMSPQASPKEVQQPVGSGDSTIPTAYDILMKQHRDAILRIHTLETENQNLTNLLKQTLSGNAFKFVDQAANPGELLARIQALEGRAEPEHALSQPVPQAVHSALTDNAETPRVSSHEIVQLRVQNQTLVGQISDLDTRLQKIKSEQGPRRRLRSPRERKQGLLQRLLGR